MLLSSGQEFDEKFLDSKYVLKVYFKPSRKKKYFVFLPLPILPVRLKILHLIEAYWRVQPQLWSLIELKWHFVDFYP